MTVRWLSNISFFDVPTKSELTRPSADCQTTVFRSIKQLEEFLKKSRWTVTRQWLRSRDRRPTVKQRFWMFQAIRKVFEKSHWTVSRQWSDVTRPSADCQSRFFRRFKQMKIFFWKKSLNGHATVVGGHATVGRLSNNVFWTFQAIWKNFEKFAERSRDSGWGHATVGRLSNNIFWTFQAIWGNLEKSRWTVTRQWSEVTRPSADCRTTFFWRFKRFGKILKKVAERSRDSGWGHATVGRLSNNIFERFKQFEGILKKVAERSRDSGRKSRDHRPTVKQRFFRRFKQVEKKFEKSRWTVTRQWSEVTRPSADCQTTFFGRFKQFGKILKKVAERSRDSGRRSRDRRLTVKQRFLDVSSNLGKFWKKSPNGHATVVGGHATIGRLSNNVFWTFQAIRKKFEKSRWTVTRQWSEVTRPSADCQTTFLVVSSN